MTAILCNESLFAEFYAEETYSCVEIPTVFGSNISRNSGKCTRQEVRASSAVQTLQLSYSLIDLIPAKVSCLLVNRFVRHQTDTNVGHTALQRLRRQYVLVRTCAA